MDKTNRVEFIRQTINKLLDAMHDDDDRRTLFLHSYGVASFAALLAVKCGADREIAYIAGLLHDVSLFVSSEYSTHGEESALMATDILNKSGLFIQNEIKTISNAVLNHTAIGVISSSVYDEIIKDADVLQPFLHDTPEPAWPPAEKRLSNILNVLNLYQ